MSSLQIIYSTFPDKKSAEKIAIEIIKLKLAACVNIFPILSSIYEWKGKIVNGKEVALLAKTQKRKKTQLIKMIEALHPYECPCVIHFNSVKVNTKYLEWVRAQTK